LTKHFWLHPLLLVAGSLTTYGYEYKLQFTPPSGARALVVAGYSFAAGKVNGNCSYDTVTALSGRGGRTSTHHYYNACVWDLYGNLVSLTPVTAPLSAPPIQSTSGTMIVYATSGSSTTGVDTRGFGFVSTPSSHFTWQSVNNTYATIPNAPYTITASLISDGDIPLTYSGATAAASVSGAVTTLAGTATVTGTTCPHSIAPGASCSITVTYNPATIRCTASPYGFAYTKLTLSPITDAGALADFTIGFTVTGIPICDD
jgi:hypothetical protein